MAAVQNADVKIGAARMVSQKPMDAKDTSILHNLRNASTALSIASVAPIPVVSPVLKGLSTVTELAGDVIDPKVSAGSATKNFVGGAAGTVASIVPGGGAAVKAVEIAKKIDTGIKVFDGVAGVAGVAANAGSYISGGENVTAITVAKTPKVPAAPKSQTHS